ncbi:hypothetical protein GZH49_40005 [Nocardia terpenica]|uniref:hypothetical protein n=1 Tax=Nocardia terpenica TaxID=455432 RepID=UPI002FE0401A
MRSRSYFNHKTLLIRQPSTKSWTSYDMLTIDEVLNLVEQAIDEVPDETHRRAARILFGIERDKREISPGERRSLAAYAINRSQRTLQRLQPTLIAEVAKGLVTILTNQK